MIIRHRAGIVKKKKKMHSCDFVLPRIENMRAFKTTAEDRNVLLADPDLFVVVLSGVTMTDVRRYSPPLRAFFLGFCPVAIKPAAARLR